MFVLSSVKARQARAVRGARLAMVCVTAVGLAALSWACGDDETSSGPGLTGMYQVTTHTGTAEGSCDDAQPVADLEACFDCAVRAPFFKVKSQNFFGQTILALVDCSSETACDDDEDDPDTINLSGPIFDRRSGAGWLGEAKVASGSGDLCTYSGSEFHLDPSEEGVTFTLTRRIATPQVSSTDECLDLTDNPPPDSELTCDRMETVIGRAL